LELYLILTISGSLIDIITLQYSSTAEQEKI